jgi:uncharacterized peroxidase-related enzyme
MDPFIIHTTDSADELASQILTGIHKKLGFVPNVFAVMGNSSPALAGFVALNRSVGESSLSPLEREVVQTSISVDNNSGYCVAGHSAFAQRQDLDHTAIQAVRRGDPIADIKLQALRLFARQMIAHRGRLSEAQVSAFLAAGYNRDQVFDVILAIAVKFFSNLTSNICRLPLDAPFAAHVWTPPESNTSAGRAESEELHHVAG